MSFEVDDGCVIAQVTSLCADRFTQDAKKYRELNTALCILRENKLSADDNHQRIMELIIDRWARVLQIKTTDVIALFNNLHGNA